MKGNLTVGCRYCGRAIDLALDPNLPDDLYRQLACMAEKGISCDQCARLTDAERKRTDEAARLLKLSERWEALTPTRYHTSDEWLETPAAALRCNMAAIRRVMDWQFGPKGLLIYGQRSGTGKTTAMWLLLREQCLAGRYVAAMTHTEFTRTATQMAREEKNKADRWRRFLTTCDVLFLDDLGKGRFMTADGVARAAEEALFEIVDIRLNEGRPIIITTNDDPDTLRSRMSSDRAEPFIRRLREACEPIPFG